jgi:hypothetical protein
VVRSFDPGSITRGTACLTSVCIQADLGRCTKCKVLRAVESPLLGYNDLLGGFEELDCIVPRDRKRNGGFWRERIRGVDASLPPTKYHFPLPNP